MPELPNTSLAAASFAYLLPCIMSALIALVAWQGYHRLHENILRDAALAFAIASVIQFALLIGESRAVLPLLLYALDCVSVAVMSWAFFGSTRWAFLVSALSVCGVLGTFTFSLWQVDGQEPAWAAQVWWLSESLILGAATVSLWSQRRERSLLLTAAWAVLTLGYLVGATGQIEIALVVRLAALPLIMVALMQFATREIEDVRSELVLFSEHSLRQTQQLLTLLRASTALIGRSDVAAILNEAVEGIGLGVGADTVLAALLDDPKEHTLRIHAIYPPKPSLRGQVIPLSAQPAIAEAMRLGQQMVLSESQRGVHALAKLTNGAAGPAIVQPLSGQGHALGVIVAINGRHRRAFIEEEQRVMEAFGAQVATAAENALLDRVIESQTRELAELLVTREEQANRQTAILESIADGVIVFDHNEQAIAFNPAASAILGFDPKNLIGKPAPAIMDGQIHPEDYAIIRSLIEGKRPPLPGLKVRWGAKTVSLSVAPVKLPSASRHGTVMVLRDVTQDAEVDRLKSEFVSVVSHELRSPFAMLDSSMQVIKKYGLEHLLPGQREQLQQLGDELKRAEAMVNNLVTFAAFLSKQGQLRVTALDLGKLACDAAQGLESIAQARNVTVTLELAEEIPPVYGDRERLTEAIYHMVHNAIKFNRPGGTVVVSCRTAPGNVIVEVADTGVGIPTERLPAMWKDFTQLADPLRRSVEGLGLGLPLVRYVIEAHGGQVWADSTVGQGSVFGFSLPLATPEAPFDGKKI